MAGRSYALSREQKALKAVEIYEKKHGRKAHRTKQGVGYDFASSRRKIEVKTISQIQSGFVQLNANQFKVLCAENNYWIYLVVLDPKPQVFPFHRNKILPFIRSYVHFDYFYKKRDLLQMASS